MQNLELREDYCLEGDSKDAPDCSSSLLFEDYNKRFPLGGVFIGLKVVVLVWSY